MKRGTSDSHGRGHEIERSNSGYLSRHRRVPDKRKVRGLGDTWKERSGPRRCLNSHQLWTRPFGYYSRHRLTVSTVKVSTTDEAEWSSVIDTTRTALLFQVPEHGKS